MNNILYMILGAAIYALIKKILASIGRFLYRKKAKIAVEMVKRYMEENPDENHEKLKRDLEIVEKALNEDVI